MRESARLFFEYFDDLMERNQMIPEGIVVPKLRTYEINGENIGPNEIVDIVKGLKDGDIEIVKRWREMLKILEEYFENTLDSFHENRRDPNRDQHYGDDDYDGPSLIRLEDSMEFLIEKILGEMQGGKTFDYLGNFDFAMKPEEDMALQSLMRQGIQKKDGSRLYLPKEIIEKEIGTSVGIRPRGGKKTKKRKTKSTKNNNKNKNKNKMRKTRTKGKR